MRPVKLTLTDFMAYKGTHTLSFSDWQIFVLTGPTGSGKSSLIDALTCALYGEVYRVKSSKKTSIKDLIYHQSSKSRLELVFELGQETYQIIREFSRKGQAKASVYQEYKGDFIQEKLPRKKQVDQFIESLLGMDFKTFNQVLVLPQGAFDRFLKPQKPGDRREALKELLQLSVYDKLQVIAAGKEKHLNEELLQRQGRLQELGIPSDSEHQSLKEELLTLNSQYTVLKKQLESQGKELQELEELRHNLEAYQSAKEEREVHLKRKVEIQELKTQLSQQKKLIPQLSRLEQWQKSLKEQAQLSQIEETLKREKSELEQLESELETLFQQDALAQPRKQAIQSRQSVLHSTRSELETYKLHYAHYKELKQQSEQTLKQCQSLSEELKRKDNRQHDLKENIQHLQTHISGPDPEPELEALRKTRKYVLEKEQLEAQKREKEHLLSDNQAEQEELNRKKGQYETLLFQLQSEAETYQTKRMKLEEQREKALRDQQLAPYKARLSLQSPCPLCEQEIHQLPPIKASELLPLESELTRLEADIQVLDKRIEKGERSIQEQIWQQEQLAKSNQKTQDELKNIEQQLSKIPGDTLSLEALEAQINALEAQRQIWRKNRELLQQSQQELELLVHKRSVTQGHLEELTRLQKEQETQKKEVETRSQSSLARLKETLQVSQKFEATLEKELEELQEEQLRLEAQNETLRQKEKAAIRLKGAFSEKNRFHQERKDQLQEELSVLQKALEPALQSLGLALENALSFWVGYDTISRWEEQIADYDETLKTLIKQEGEYLEKTDGKVFSEGHYSTLQTQKQSNEEEVTSLLQKKGALESQLQRIEAQIARAQDLEEESRALEKQWSIYAQIKRDFNSDQLPQFVLNHFLEYLLNLASEELFKMTDRYTFALTAGETVVKDQWNAGETRAIHTLSGGESFMAALSLALAMNEYLSLNTHLGSLFIDEGFGTLDPESLDTAAAAIESLTERNKLIGIITHVRELAERFPVQVRINKRIEGSQIEVQ